MRATSVNGSSVNDFFDNDTAARAVMIVQRERPMMLTSVAGSAVLNSLSCRSSSGRLAS